MEIRCPEAITPAANGTAGGIAECSAVLKPDGSTACVFTPGIGRDVDLCTPVDCMVTSSSVAEAVVNFVVIFIGSVVVGSAIALFSVSVCCSIIMCFQYNRW